jgi:hypothetical protein
MADRYSERGHPYEFRGDERGFFDRLRDELRSWFGDEEAQRRRMRDEREEAYGDRRDMGARDWGRGSDWSREPEPREWGRQWGHVENRGQGAGDRWRDWNRGAGTSGFGGGGYSAGYDRERDWGRTSDWGRPSDWGRQPDWGRHGSADRGVYQGTLSDQREAGGPTGAWRGDRDWGRFSGGAEYGMGGERWMAGAQTGRGPRNYQRPDDRIRDEICERLAHHPHLDASDLDVRVQNGDVTLQGSVADRWAKRWAEDVAEGIWGVKQVHNQVRVNMLSFDDERREGQTGQAQAGQTGQEGQRPGQQRGPWAA